MAVEQEDSGIYYLIGDAIPIQLVIVPKLSKEHNYWLNNLRNDLKAGSEIKKITESGKDSVDDIVKGVENGDILLSNNIQKGNYGEMNMDVYFKSQGYERISLDRVTDLNAPTHQGIDGVYYNLDGHPPYIIGEAKYGSSRLAILADGTPQMSDKWIIDRLENAVGEGVANDIKMEMILKWK